MEDGLKKMEDDLKKKNGRQPKKNMKMQTGETYLESSWTKEKYTTQVTDHIYAWSDVWWEV